MGICNSTELPEPQRPIVGGAPGIIGVDVDPSQIPEKRGPMAALEIRANNETVYRRRKKTFEPQGSLDFISHQQIWDLRNILDEPVGRFYMLEYCEAKKVEAMGLMAKFWIAIHLLKYEEMSLEEAISRTRRENELELDPMSTPGEKTYDSGYERAATIVSNDSRNPDDDEKTKAAVERILAEYLRPEAPTKLAFATPEMEALKASTLEKAEAALSEDRLHDLRRNVFLEIQNAAIMTMAENNLFKQFIEHSEYKRYLLKFGRVYNTVSHRDFEYMQVLGKGSFGRVIRVRKKTTKKQYALKVMAKKKIIEGAENVSQVNVERNVIVMCDHRNIVKTYFCFQTSRALFLALELLEGGNLNNAMRECGGKLTPEIIRFQSAQIILGLDHLHRHGILYRDLKPVNVMLDRYGNAVITDLGLCAKFRDSEFPKDHGAVSAHGIQLKRRNSMTVVPPNKLKCVGTHGYRAPEVLSASELREGYSQEIDYWALGVSMYYLVTAKYPFRARTIRQNVFSPTTDLKALERKLQKTPPNFREELPDAVLADCVAGLLEPEPSKRLGHKVADVKAHEFFKDIDWEKLEAGELKPVYVPPVKNYAADEQPVFDGLQSAMTQLAADNVLELFGGENDLNGDYRHVRRQHQKYFDNWDYIPDEMLEKEFQEAEAFEREQYEHID